MARVPLVAPEDASAEQRAAFAVVAARRGRVANLFRAMAHSPEATRRVGDLGSFLRFESSLPGRLREAVILAVSARWRCGYERAQHEPLARALGLSDAALAELRRGRVPAELGPAEAAAVRYARALARGGRAPEELLVPLRRALDERGLVELHLLVGYYSLLALFLNGLEVEVESG